MVNIKKDMVNISFIIVCNDFYVAMIEKWRVGGYGGKNGVSPESQTPTRAVWFGWKVSNNIHILHSSILTS
jgi:hypothetical protein